MHVRAATEKQEALIKKFDAYYIRVLCMLWEGFQKIQDFMAIGPRGKGGGSSHSLTGKIHKILRVSGELSSDIRNDIRSVRK